MGKISHSRSEGTNQPRDKLDLRRNGSRIQAQKNIVIGTFRLKSWTSHLNTVVLIFPLFRGNSIFERLSNLYEAVKGVKPRGRPRASD